MRIPERVTLALLALLLFSAPAACAAEEGQTVYFLGNFAFGMPIDGVRAMDTGGAALEETDAERNVQRLTLLSQSFAVTLWFQGLEGSAPLIEMDFAFFMPPDTVTRRENRLDIQTTEKTLNTVYAYVERLCQKTFGPGKNAPDAPPSPASLLFPGTGDSFAFTRARVYSLPDGGKTDVITHLIASDGNSVNYVICRQAEHEK